MSPMRTRLSSLLKRGKKDAKSGDDPPTGVSRAALPSSSQEPGQRFGLQMLYDGTKVSHTEPSFQIDGADTVDIVAVHGLGGHPVETFTDPVSGCCWLRDILPGDFPRCRVMSFGYDLLTNFGSLTINEHAQRLCYELSSLEGPAVRPIIFVCYSLGGLLVKRGMVSARIQLSIRKIYENTRAILFFGTPNRGSSMASESDTLRKILAPFVSSSRGRELLLQTTLHSREIMRINEDFLYSAGSIQIVSFYETRKSSHALSDVIVVAKESAVIGLPNERIIASNSTYNDLCRFSKSSSSEYQHVRYVLRDICTSIKEEPGEVQEHTLVINPADSRQSWIPNMVSKVGKTAMGLFEVAGSMEDPHNFSDAEMDIVAIHGLGGSPSRSWINNESNTLWLRDFLQVDFPNVRIMSYGYKAEVALLNDPKGLDRLASDLIENLLAARQTGNRQPIAFIAYSFGGLVLKKALLHLHSASESTQITLFNSVTQVLFLGVPNDYNDYGLSGRWADIIQCTIRSRISISSQSFEQIQETTKEFCNMTALHVASVAESEPTRLSKSSDKVLLVPARSVRLGWGHSETIFVAINRNHFDLPTFIDSEDPTYAFIRDVISKTLSRLNPYSSGSDTAQCLQAIEHSSATFSELRLENIVKPYPGSCDWFFEVAQVQNWLNRSYETLLIEGPPGCGKSVLAKHLIYELERKLSSTAILHLVFDIRSSSSGSIWGALLLQLLKFQPDLINYALEAYHSKGKNFASSSEELLGVLTSAVDNYSGTRVLIVIDALDEQEEAAKISTDIMRLSGNFKFGIVILSRPVAQTAKLRQSLKPYFVNWTSVFPKGVINEFVASSLSALPEDYVPYEKKVLEHIRKLIVDKAGDSFLAASLALGELHKQVKAGHSLNKSLDEVLFTGGNQLYDSVLSRLHQRLSEQEWILLPLVLSILLLSVEPINFGQLVEVLEREDETTLEDIIVIIGSEKKVDYGFTVRNIFAKSFGMISDSVTSGYIDISPSFAQYLLSNPSKTNSLWPSLVVGPEGHLSMVKKCIAAVKRYLTITPNDGTTPTDIETTFTGYALSNWIRHFFLSQDIADEALQNSCYELLNLIYSSDRRTGSLSPFVESLPRLRNFEPLFGAAYFGLRPVVKRALDIGADIEAQDSEGKTALHWASELGHTDIVAQLVHSGAGINFPAYNGWTALHFAVRQGNWEIISLLLDCGADVNALAADGRGALHISMELDRYSIVALLLERGADASQKAYDGLGMIQLASTEPKLDILMKSTKAASALLRRSVYDNDIVTLGLLMQRRSDVIAKAYPWVRELLEVGLSNDEISDLLLKSENLDWMEPEESEIIPTNQHKKPVGWWRCCQDGREVNSTGTKKNCCPSDNHHKCNNCTSLRSPQFDEDNYLQDMTSRLKHHQLCAHQLDLVTGLETGFLVRSGSPARGEAVGPPSAAKGEVIGSVSGKSSQGTSSTSGPATLPGGPQDLEHHFDELAKREQEVMSRCGIGGIFPPGQPVVNPGFARMRLNAIKILYGDQGPVE